MGVLETVGGKAASMVSGVLPFADYGRQMFVQSASNVVHDHDRWGYTTRIMVGGAAGLTCMALPFLPATGATVMAGMGYIGISGTTTAAVSLATTGSGVALYVTDYGVDKTNEYRFGDSKPYHDFSAADAQRAIDCLNTEYSELRYSEESIAELLPVDIKIRKTVNRYFDYHYHFLEAQHVRSKFLGKEKALDKNIEKAKLRPELFGKHATYELAKIAEEQERIRECGCIAVKETEGQRMEDVKAPAPSLLTRAYTAYLSDRKEVLHTLDSNGIQRRFDLLQARKDLIEAAKKELEPIETERKEIISRVKCRP